MNKNRELNSGRAIAINIKSTVTMFIIVFEPAGMLGSMNNMPTIPMPAAIALMINSA
jgi:hypothetical protein